MGGARSADILVRVARIAPILDRTAADSERLRTLCPEAVDACHDAGLFGLWVPKEVGGFDADLVTQVDALVALARADMSACWTMMIGNTVTGEMAACLPDEGLAEVFAGDRLPVAAGSLKPSGRAERVADGYRVSGKWDFGSGIRHAEWIVANCVLGAPETPRGISLVIPIAEVEVADDWHVAGLCGTGSCSYTVVDVLVPARRAMGKQCRGTFFNANAGPRLPIEHASVSLGGARRALDETVRLSATKRRLMDPATVASKQSFQVEIGKLEAQWATLFAGVRAAADGLSRAAEGGSADVGPAAAKLKAISAHTAEQCLVIGGRALRHAGAGAVHEAEVLQRVYRDLVVAAQHVMVADSAFEEYGITVLDGSNASAR